MLKAQGRQDVSGFEVDCARRRRQTRQLYPSQTSQPFAICILKQYKYEYNHKYKHIYENNYKYNMIVCLSLLIAR